MRIRSYIIPVLAAADAAVAIAAAPTAAADPTSAQPAVIATAPTAVAAHIVPAGHGGVGFPRNRRGFLMLPPVGWQ